MKILIIIYVQLPVTTILTKYNFLFIYRGGHSNKSFEQSTRGQGNASEHLP